MAGIYVHVPYCHAKCAYCDFYSIADRRSAPDFVRAVLRQLKADLPLLDGQEVNTVYFGGGTPSALSTELFAELAAPFPLAHVEEFTIEVNPEDVVPEKIATWLKAGVNRVSMGVQSLVDSELRAVNRRHTAREAIEAIRRLRSEGISNISCDLIYGLPGQTIESWRQSLDELLGEEICHLSAYALSYEPGTLLSLRLRRGEVAEASDNLMAEMYDELCRVTRRHGFNHYEISNFSLPGMHSRHNSAYWASVPYLGLGPGAHSLDAFGVRRYVPDSIKKYIEAPETAAVVDEETETDRINDMIFTALRTAHGLDISALPVAERTEVMRNARRFIATGQLAIADGNRLYIPENHWLIADAIIRELLVD